MYLRSKVEGRTRYVLYTLFWIVLLGGPRMHDPSANDYVNAFSMKNEFRSNVDAEKVADAQKVYYAYCIPTPPRSGRCFFARRQFATGE